ncbi:MAG TPA: hypothetical protein P5330_06985 [Candidatus Competibacteraceae bacterium]|nr:hypothetical protein [Candidatus Competibacteraceae bacterium]
MSHDTVRGSGRPFLVGWHDPRFFLNATGGIDWAGAGLGSVWPAARSSAGFGPWCRRTARSTASRATPSGTPA